MNGLSRERARLLQEGKNKSSFEMRSFIVDYGRKTVTDRNLEELSPAGAVYHSSKGGPSKRPQAWRKKRSRAAIDPLFKPANFNMRRTLTL